MFVDAYQFIPEHRRLPLFVKLMNTLGVRKYLDALTCLSVESYIKGNSLQSEVLPETDIQVIIELFRFLQVCCVQHQSSGIVTKITCLLCPL